MAKTVKSINIKAPVEKVFDYLCEPTNLPEIWPSLVEVKDVQKLPNGSTKNIRESDISYKVDTK